MNMMNFDQPEKTMKMLQELLEGASIMRMDITYKDDYMHFGDTIDIKLQIFKANERK